eukprot:94391_1
MTCASISAQLDMLDNASHQTRSISKLLQNVISYIDKIEKPVSNYHFKIIEKCIIINCKPVNVAYMNIYCQGLKSKQIINGNVIPSLISLVKQNNYKAIACLANIIFNDIQYNPTSTKNLSHMIQLDLIPILIQVLSDCHSNYGTKTALGCFGNICATNEQSRNLSLKENILKYILPLLCNATTSCPLYIQASEVMFYICKHDKSPSKQYLKQILMALSVMIMYENDNTVIDNAISSYSFLIRNIMCNNEDNAA